MSATCRPPIYLERVLDDPMRVRGLLEENAPYSPVQRYFNSAAEYRLSSGQESRQRPMIIAPNFRGDWAYERGLVGGVDPILQHEGFREAARQIFGSECVRPFSVYSNITWQLPFNQGAGHVDVPEFRGINRTEHPIWLLQAMGHSRLFEEERVDIATAVSWFYTGDDGGFSYWPEGPHAAVRHHEGEIFNTAIVGDNDRMFHRVRPVGRREDGMLTQMTLDGLLVHCGGERWEIREGEKVLAAPLFEQLRVSISWKAKVFKDAQEERLYLDHSRDLSLEDVLDRFYADLCERGIESYRPREPLRDPDFVDLLSASYVTEPAVQQ